MSLRSYIPLFVGLIFVVLHASEAAAQVGTSPRNPTAAASEAPSYVLPNPYTPRARAAFATGLEAFRSGDYSSACDAWEGAYALSAKVEIKFDLGLAYYRLGLYKESTAAFAEFFHDCAGEAECLKTGREIEPNPYRSL